MSEIRVHILKCWPESFRAIKAGTKRHEVRKDDRGYMVGDYLRLDEFEPYRPPYHAFGQWEQDTTMAGRGEFTKAQLWLRVTYKTPGGSWGLPADVWVLSVEMCDPPEPAPRPGDGGRR